MPTRVSFPRLTVDRKLDLVLSRLERLEQRMSWQANNAVASSPRSAALRSRILPPASQERGIAHLNQQTGCFEYYGRTSNFMVASSLGKRLRQLEDTADVSSPPAKHRRVEPELSAPHDENPRSLRLDELTSFCDYVVPANALRRDRYLSEAIADRHLDSFFRTTHVFLPILDPAAFRARYAALRRLFGDRRLVLPTPDDPGRAQFVCLMYAVLALGALYEDGHEDSSSWASWYFAEAQDMLGHLLDATNLQSVQAAMFLVSVVGSYRMPPCSCC
jgi:hypothetical protein